MIAPSKYPRTPHLPWSPGGTRDDRRIKDASIFVNRELVITEKLDGSNVCLTSTEVFARSHGKPATHPSFDLLKGIHAAIRHKIDPCMPLFGEYCYAVHSIVYDALPSYFFLFGVVFEGASKESRKYHCPQWDPWEQVQELSKILNVLCVPELFTGKVNSLEELEKLTQKLANQPSEYGGKREGLVVRMAGAFSGDNFDKRVAKWVRKDHVQTDKHWANCKITKQKLRS